MDPKIAWEVVEDAATGGVKLQDLTSHGIDLVLCSALLDLRVTITTLKHNLINMALNT